VTSDDLSPRAVLSTLEISTGNVHVVRDDLLPGGTKLRAVHAYLREALASGVTSFVYASPPPGFAQVALAYVCRRLGVDCVLFCEQAGGEFHEYSLLARSYGATIHPCATLRVAEKEAQAYEETLAHSRKLPLGFADPAYVRYLREAVAREWAHVTADLGGAPRRVWLPVGSATLGLAFADTLPGDVGLHCVDVRVLEPDDHRLRALAARPGVTMYRTGELFAQQCADRPPIPANAHYDAKLWAFVKQHGSDGDLWWNVAR
jgi:hypothetical protein